MGQTRVLKAVKKCISQDYLLGLGCHYFSKEGGGLRGTTLSLWHFVTISLGRVGVKAIMDNVTKYDVFFFEGVPYTILSARYNDPLKGLDLDTSFRL